MKREFDWKITRTLFAWFPLALAALWLVLSPVHAQQEVDEEQLKLGKKILQENCGSCHATKKTDQNNHPDAPLFRELSKLYPVEYLAESLAEGIVSGHPDMPVFEFEPSEIDGIIAYLQSIQVK